MAIFEVISRYTYLGESIQNNWYFEETDGNGTAVTMDDAFQFNIIPVLFSALSDSLVGSTILVKNMENPLDFGEFGYRTVSTGSQTGNEEPSTITARLRFSRPRSDIKGGRKSFSGLTEGQVSGNTLSSPTVAILATLSDLLHLGFTDQAANVTYKVGYYAKPKGQTDKIFVRPLAVIPRGLVGTQNSRKPF